MTTNLDVRDVKQYCYNAEWTTQTPTEPGWYWAKTDSGIYMFNLQKSITGGLYFESIGEWWDAAMEEYKIAHWLGPLPEPRFEE